MARRIVLDFDKANQSLIVSNLVTTQALETIPLAAPYPFIFPNFARTVSFHSTSDLSGITFTVSGKDQYGYDLENSLVGPTANNTVYTLVLYHTIDNIEADGAIANLSIGSGPTGVSQWIPVNNFSVEGSINLQIDRTATITYSVTQTNDVLESYESAGATYSYVVNNEVNSFPVDASLTAATTNQLYKVAIPAAAYQIAITLSSGNGALTFTILQQGVN
jgi:hypothetical protein